MDFYHNTLIRGLQAKLLTPIQKTAPHPSDGAPFSQLFFQQHDGVIPRICPFAGRCKSASLPKGQSGKIVFHTAQPQRVITFCFQLCRQQLYRLPSKSAALAQLRHHEPADIRHTRPGPIQNHIQDGRQIIALPPSEKPFLLRRGAGRQNGELLPQIFPIGRAPYKEGLPIKETFSGRLRAKRGSMIITAIPSSCGR